MTDSALLPVPAETQILIVGAGPSGLATAISLISNGIQPSNIAIVDGLEKHANSSRALAIHAATLEALDKYGCASKLVESGIKGSGLRVGDRTSTFVESRFSCITSYTKFPFVLALAQVATEKILEDRLNELGVEVLRPYRVTGMKESDKGQGIDVLLESGSVIRTNYVIGADGARSVIRQASGINFADPDGQSYNHNFDERVGQMVLADVSFSGEGDQAFLGTESGASMCATADGMCLLIPFGKPSSTGIVTNETIYRVGFNIPQSVEVPPSEPSLEYLQTKMDRQAPLHLTSNPETNPNPVHITHVHWATRYRTHSSIADVFFKRIHGGVVLLVGDSGHIHSPVGGQGMNLGLRDALGLGSVLAEHINNGNEDTTDLENYAASRRVRGLENIKLTKKLMGVLDFMVQPRWFNWPKWILRLLLRVPFFERQIVYRLSGLGNW
ncbi:FAD/NAD(P)-binding domain-containing protein [Rhodocollybia butyracea]|uniref:FAD/NAD(P)-binding domain-containing protein n=1 Tax=Rhodocollybia butyracea TaxID=206335 RepID=A0A9P5U2T6_9AGAR|nr:FAD/NAD(P)-binding domain-containing protein [Rhodocollybia butyracea]